MHASSFHRIALTLAACAAAGAVAARQQAPVQPPSAAASPGWQGCCGVTPWGAGGGGMMGGGRGGMMGGGYGGGMMGGGHGYGMMGGSSARHHIAMSGGVPAPYTNLANPLPQTPATIQRGEAVYAANCASCHGATGAGDGAAARSLTPPPANLAWLSNMPLSRWDPFMYWTIAEGGKPLGSGMPSFKDSLSKSDIWAVIAYIQAHLPAKAAAK